MSGLITKVWLPQKFPVRPKPQMTSSTMNSMSYFFTTAWIFEIGRRRHDHAARPLDRLGDEGGTGLGAFLQDHLLEVVGHQVAKSSSLSSKPVPVIVRVVGVEHVRDRQIEALMVVRLPGQARRGDHRPMIADPADDLLLVMTATGVVACRRSSRRVDRLRSGWRGTHRHRDRRQPDQLLRQIDARLMALVRNW